MNSDSVETKPEQILAKLVIQCSPDTDEIDLKYPKDWNGSQARVEWIAEAKTALSALLEAEKVTYSITDLELLEHQTGQDEVVAIPLERIKELFNV